MAMKYVLLTVLVAAAMVVAVVVFSRAVGGGFITSARSVSGNHSEAAEMHHKQQSDRNADSEKARQYSDSMSR